MLELIGTKKLMGAGPPLLRRQHGEVLLATLPPIQVVNISGLLH